MAVGVDATKAAAVLGITLSKLDVTDDDSIVKIGDNANDLVVFSDLLLYLSSGAKFGGK